MIASPRLVPFDIGAALSAEASTRSQPALARVAGRFARCFAVISPFAPGLSCIGAEVELDGDAAAIEGATRISATGTGTTLSRALLSCLGEAADLVSQYERPGDIAARGAVGIDGSSMLDGWIAAALGENAERPIDWVAGVDAQSGGPSLLPADLCLRRPSARCSVEPVGPLSAGVAAGRTFEAAALRAVLELCERHALASWWLGGRPARRFPDDHPAALSGRATIDRLRTAASGRVSRLIELGDDLGIPVVAAVSLDGDGRGLACGAAARLDPAEAAEAAVLELCQMEMAAPLARAKLAQGGAAALNSSDRRHVRREAWLADGCALLAPDRMTDLPSARAAVDPWTDLLGRLAARDIAVHVVDLTRPDVGVPVVRALAPRLKPYGMAHQTDRLQVMEERADGAPASADIPLLSPREVPVQAKFYQYSLRLYQSSGFREAAPSRTCRAVLMRSARKSFVTDNVQGVLGCLNSQFPVAVRHRRANMHSDTRSRAVLSAEILRRLFDSSRDWIKVLDLDGTLLITNIGSPTTPTCIRTAECSNWAELWLAEDRDGARRAIDTARRGGIGRFRGCTERTAAPTWWDSVVTPILGPEGKPDTLLVVSRDVTDTQELTAALQVANRRTDALIWATSEIVWWASANQTTGGGRGWTEFTGQDTETAAGDGWLASVHPNDRARATQVCTEAMASSTAYLNEYRLFHRASGAWRWVIDRAMPLIGADGGVLEWVGIISDVHDRKIAEHALRTSEERLRLAVDASGVGTWDVDLVDGTRIWSDQIRLMLGIGPDAEASEDLLIERVHPADRDRVRQANRAWGTAGETATEVIFRIVRQDTHEIRWIASSGRACLDAAGRPVRRVGTWQDITDRKHAEDKIWTAANLDPLTSLANRSLFHARLEQAVRDATGAGGGVALLVIDLDQFKEINDTLGHDAGDAVLKMMADRITACVGERGDVARLGGDEFAVLLPGLRTQADVSSLAQAIIEQVAAPMHHGGVVLNCTVSIGSSSFPADDGSRTELLKNADMALYAAKAAGRNRYAAYHSALRTAIERRVTVLRSARTALERDAIVPFYQPKVSLLTNETVGFEALLRWRNAGGIQGPAAIQEAFADPELAIQIGERMLAKVVEDIRTWRKANVRFGSVALNVSGAELANVDVAERTLAALRAAGLPTNVLEIEVVESVLFDDRSDRAIDMLRRLEREGVALSLDDFGTGFASLTHLQKVPVKWLKIDRSFMKDLPSRGASAAIVRSVVGLAHDLGMQVVAEGVETRLQQRALGRMNCDVVQGYLVAKPMAASRVAHFLETWIGFPETRVPAPTRVALLG